MRAPCNLLLSLLILLIQLILLILLKKFNGINLSNLHILQNRSFFVSQFHNDHTAKIVSIFLTSMPAYKVSKTVLGSFNQANREMFGETAGTQCSANCLYAIFWSNVRRVSIWKTTDLDRILIEGDKLYKQLNTNSYLSVDEMPHFIESNGIVTELHFLNSENGQAKLINDYPLLQIPLSMAPNPDFDALVIIEGFTIAIMRRPQGFFLFDSHSRNEFGLLEPLNGKSCLIKFEDIFELEKYIQHFYLEENNKDNLFFLIQFIKVGELKEDFKKVLQRSYSGFVKKSAIKRKNDSDDGNVLKKRQKTRQESNHKFYEKNKEILKENQNNYRALNKESQKVYRVQNNEKIKDSNKIYRNQNKEKIKKSKKAYRTQNSDKIKENKKAYRERNKEKRKETNSRQKERIAKFKTLVNEGPFYICVCCNRCLYRQTVVKYTPENYNMPEENFCSEVISFDGQLYICKTCHNKLKKDNLPCQSVKNKLDIYELPAEFHTLRRLEKVLISQRILFKKIAIMPKGQFPKLKGSICNVPIDIEDI
eukprot:TCONS_00043273-protein